MTWIILIIVLAVIVAKSIRRRQYKELEAQYKELEAEVLSTLGFSNWNFVPYFDTYVTVKSRQTLGKYDEIKFFKGNREMLEKAEETIKRKNETAAVMRKFLNDNEYKSNSQYDRIVEHVNIVLKNAGAFRIKVRYISSAGNYLASKEITVTQDTIDRLHQDPSLLMDKGEYKHRCTRGTNKIK